MRFQTPRDYIEDFTASMKAQISRPIFVTTHGCGIWVIFKIDK